MVMPLLAQAECVPQVKSVWYWARRRGHEERPWCAGGIICESAKILAIYRHIVHFILNKKKTSAKKTVAAAQIISRDGCERLSLHSCMHCQKTNELI
jgi:hypothetical protein